MGAVLVAAAAAIFASGSIAAAPAQASCLLGTLFCSADPPPPPVSPDPGGSESPNQSLPVPGKGFGFNVAYEPNGDSSPTTSLQAMAATGANYVRDSIVWRAFYGTSPSEPVTPEMQSPLGSVPSYSSLARWDNEYLDLTARGITPIFVLWNVPPWASTLHNCMDMLYALMHMDQCPSGWDQQILFPDPQYYPQWQAWVAAMTRRYPKAIIEGPNEPDYQWAQHTAGNGYPNAVSPETAAAIQCQLYQGVRSVDNRTVLSMALRIASFEQYYLPNARGCYTGFSFHPYPYGTSYGDETFYGRGSGLADEFKWLGDNRTAAGDTTPIWVTETGFSFVPGSDASSNASREAHYADGSQRLYNRLITMSGVTAVLFHTLRDNPTANENNPNTVEYHFGFFNADWTAKTRGCAFVLNHGSTWTGC